ncbi:hypothetical protein Glove_130g185 [Diversispora epigaea]|uniref:Uncharacterized protein n=1 Tax=Diversispora epigaea TaxID=1348612 RepID=A0A397J845_9GLOM|nr:hypothetical protein Glove_130g185 [Diversispora epigaea]
MENTELSTKSTRGCRPISFHRLMKDGANYTFLRNKSFVRIKFLEKMYLIQPIYFYSGTDEQLIDVIRSSSSFTSSEDKESLHMKYNRKVDLITDIIIGENDEKNNNVIDNFNFLNNNKGEEEKYKIEFIKMLSLDKSDITQLLLSNNNNNSNHHHHPKLSQEDI